MSKNPLEGLDPKKAIRPEQGIKREHVLERFRVMQEAEEATRKAQEKWQANPYIPKTGASLEEITEGATERAEKRRQLFLEILRETYGKSVAGLREKYTGNVDDQGRPIFEVVGFIKEGSAERETTSLEMTDTTA